MVDDPEPLRRRGRVGPRALLIVAVAGVVTTLVVVAAIGAGRRSDNRVPPAVEAAVPIGVGAGSAPDGPSGVPRPRAERGATTTTSFAFPESYVGDVWVTLSPDGVGTRDVTITWGPWARAVAAPAGKATTFRFRKSFDPAGTPTPALTVGGEPVLGVEFGYGVPPAGAIDINEGWVAVPQAAGP